MFKNVASQKLFLFAFDTTTNLPKTGDAANITGYVSINGGVPAAIVGSAGELDATNMKGWYMITLSQAETNGDNILYGGKSSTANVQVVGQVVYTLPANFTALSISAGGLVDILQTAADKVWGSTTRTLSAAGVQAIWDALTSALTTAGSVGKLLVDNINATISSRLATAGYTAPLDAAGTRAAVGLAAANLDTQLSTIAGYVDTEIGTLQTTATAIKAKTDNLPATPAATGDAMTLTSGERTSVADALLDRNMATGTDSGGRTVRNALRFLRNKWTLSGGTLTVTKEDDTTTAWTSTVATDGTAQPVVGSDPA